MDWDIHHGNATQHEFYNDSRYVDLLEGPLFIFQNVVSMIAHSKLFRNVVIVYMCKVARWNLYPFTPFKYRGYPKVT